MVKEIKRDYYLEQLIKREGNGLIKIVTGIRRCGKSYLLRTLFKNHLLEHGVDEKHIIERQKCWKTRRKNRRKNGSQN
jgi:uncharacterized protein